MKKLNYPLIPLTFLNELASDEPQIHSMASVRSQEGLKHMLKNVAILFCLLLLWFVSDVVLATPTEAPLNESGFSSMWLTSQDGSQTIAGEALSTEISMSVSGPILRVKVKQRFKNTSQMWLEGMYSFPLPEQAAVDQLRMIIGERIVEGQIKEKQAAKKSYEKARANGQRASLLNHHRTNIFTTSVANIAPKEEIVVEFEYQQVLDFQDHQYNLRFPMVSTPQYTPARTQLDKDFINPIEAIRSSDSKPGNPVSIKVDLQPGFPIELPSSISHPVSVDDLGKEHYQVNLNGTAELSNRDFILSWKLKPLSKPMVSILREDVGDQSYGLMMVMPPQASAETAPAIPRELIWVLDVSGSMQGESIEQARSAILKALSKLRQEDYFNIIYFNTQAWQLFPNSRAGNADNLNFARDKILKLEANGGTEMRSALNLALNQQNNSERLRQLIFVTDGAVSNEAELFSYIQANLGATRLFTVGIGSAPNSYFMRKAAITGRGSFTYISQPQEVTTKINRLLRKLETPALTDLGFDLNDPTVSVLPQVLPDVYLGEPVYISFKAENFPSYAELTGKLNGTPSSLRLSLDTNSKHEGIAVEWARRKISELVDRFQEDNNETKPRLREEAIEIALGHHQVSKFTSLVAVDKAPVRGGALLNNKRIPVNAPKGWVNQLSKSEQGIRLAQTATNTPYQLFLGSTLLALAIMVWTVWFLIIKHNKRKQPWDRA
jgi:Ca-activated chloride channel family protein